MLQTSQR